MCGRMLESGRWGARATGSRSSVIKSIETRAGQDSSNLAMLPRGRIMMDGMMGMGAISMAIWGIVGILIIVLLIVLIAKLLK